ncbi:MAG: hypothetical protein NT155_03915 [Candidatus Staskawiczbacteria bacterium]|nr:hypothetical protein [Candidatus Staskawiczbacteria bacterium]
MNKKILFLVLLGVLVLPLAVSAQASQATTIAANIKSLAVTVGMAIVVIGWVIAGILYLTAAGAPDKLGVAKKAMVAAIVGTVLIVVAVGGYAVISGIVNSALNSGT